LIESYRVGNLDAHHLDLYRIADPGELEWLGLGDLWSDPALVLVEWPERGGAGLPAADLVMHLRHAGERRELEAEALSARGEGLLAALQSGRKPAG
jgi:tRNA threonylcarbamoyladenosine biosynthesis protein TsaE